MNFLVQLVAMVASLELRIKSVILWVTNSLKARSSDSFKGNPFMGDCLSVLQVYIGNFLMSS